jgi:hypothetical protein
LLVEAIGSLQVTDSLELEHLAAAGAAVAVAVEVLVQLFLKMVSQIHYWCVK